MAGTSLVVHNFVPVSSRNGRATPLSSDQLLANGRDLVATERAREGWYALVPPQASMSGFGAGRLLIYKTPPPAASSLRHSYRVEEPAKIVKKWGVLDAGAKNVITISKLKEFRGTDFSYLATSRRPTKKRPSEEQDVDTQRERKHRRTEGAMTLYDLIPTPHHYSYPMVTTGQSVYSDITKRFPPYSKAPFIPTAQYLTEVDAYFRDPFARSAWIIPLAGRLPWKNASHAQLVDKLSGSQATGNASRSPISWTAFLINKFWTDLLEIRKRHALGAISLSFHVALPEKPQERIVETTYLGITRKRTELVPPPVDPVPTRLVQCTYIKIYHDVRYALYVRSVLDSWRTEVEVEGAPVPESATRGITRTRTRSQTGTVLAPQKMKVRPLLGAKLVLVNEIAQAVGLC